MQSIHRSLLAPLSIKTVYDFPLLPLLFIPLTHPIIGVQSTLGVLMHPSFCSSLSSVYPTPPLFCISRVLTGPEYWTILIWLMSSLPGTSGCEKKIQCRDKFWLGCQPTFASFHWIPNLRPSSPNTPPQKNQQPQSSLQRHFSRNQRYSSFLSPNCESASVSTDNYKKHKSDLFIAYPVRQSFWPTYFSTWIALCTNRHSIRTFFSSKRSFFSFSSL